MKYSTVLTLLIIGIHCGIEAAIVNSRSFTSCGYLNKKIFCFGGDLSSSITAFDLDNKLYSLDIDQFYGGESNSFNNKWIGITSNNDFDPEKRRTPEFMATTNGYNFLLVGGYSGYSSLINQTIMYNADNNTWEALPQYSEPNRGYRQIYFGTAVNLLSTTNDIVGFYGGYEANPNVTTPMVSVTNQTIPLSYDDYTSIRGFDSVTVFNVTSKEWSHFTPQLSIPKNYYPSAFTATLNPETGIIYYLGGQYYTSKSINPFKLAFNQAHVFDTKQGQWGITQLNSVPSSRIPTNRLYHSATMMPNSQDIILYGGSTDGQLAVTDFIYTLNLATNNWTEQTNVNVPTSVTQSGARFGHSAVLVNTTLFILFGRDINGNPTPNLMTFDVANISTIEYTPTYPLLLTEKKPDVQILSDAVLAIIIAGAIILASPKQFTCPRLLRTYKKSI
ncbi:unnamed protein product [Rhizopus stolonifer]